MRFDEKRRALFRRASSVKFAEGASQKRRLSVKDFILTESYHGVNVDLYRKSTF